MPKTTDPARPVRRLAAACVTALLVLVLALAPGVVLAAERSPDGPPAPAIAGADTPWSGLWGALTGAWNDLGRLFSTASDDGSSGSDPAGGDGTRKCEMDCGVDIDPNG